MALRQRPRVADAGRTAETDDGEAERLEVGQQSRAAQVAGGRRRARCERGLDPRRRLQAELARLARQQARRDQQAWVGGVGATGERGYRDGSVIRQRQSMLVSCARARGGASPVAVAPASSRSCGRRGPATLGSTPRGPGCSVAVYCGAAERSRARGPVGGSTPRPAARALPTGRSRGGKGATAHPPERTPRSLRTPAPCWRPRRAPAPAARRLPGRRTRGSDRRGRCSRSRAQSVSARSVAVRPGRSRPSRRTPTTSGTRMMSWDAEADAFGFQASDAPAEHADPVDHGRVAVGAYQGVRVCAVGSGPTCDAHHRRQSLEIERVHDARAGRMHAHAAQRARRPLHEPVPLGIACDLAPHVLFQRTG